MCITRHGTSFIAWTACSKFCCFMLVCSVGKIHKIGPKSLYCSTPFKVAHTFIFSGVMLQLTEGNGFTDHRHNDDLCLNTSACSQCKGCTHLVGVVVQQPLTQKRQSLNRMRTWLLLSKHCQALYQHWLQHTLHVLPHSINNSLLYSRLDVLVSASMQCRMCCSPWVKPRMSKFQAS